MKKGDEIRFLLAQDCSPKEIAERVGCSLSHVYAVRHAYTQAHVGRQLTQIEDMLAETLRLLRALSGQPADPIENYLARNT